MRRVASVTPKGHLVQFSLTLTAPQSDRCSNRHQIIVRSNGDVIVVDVHRCTVNGKIARQIIGFQSDSPYTASGTVHVDKTVESCRDRLIAIIQLHAGILFQDLVAQHLHRAVPQSRRSFPRKIRLRFRLENEIQQSAEFAN